MRWLLLDVEHRAEVDVELAALLKTIAAIFLWILQDCSGQLLWAGCEHSFQRVFVNYIQILVVIHMKKECNCQEDLLDLSQQIFTCSKSTIEALERCQWAYFIVNFEHISHPFLVFASLTLSMYLNLFAGLVDRSWIKFYFLSAKPFKFLGMIQV